MESLSLFGFYVSVVVVFLLIISALVAAHELGHYLFARLFGMGVEEFSIGFGKKPIWTWMRKTYKVEDADNPGAEATETTSFTIRPWPFGGFVRIKGMVPEDDGSEVHIPGGFYQKPPWQRFIVLLAGPAFSVIAGIALLVPLFVTLGVERSANKPVLGTMNVEKAGYKAGLRPGDRIVSIDGKPTKTFYDFLVIVRDSNAQPLEYVIERDGEQKTFTVAAEWSDEDTPVLDHNLEMTGEFRHQPVLGVGMTDETVLVPVSFGEAVAIASLQPVRAVRNIISLVQRPKNFGRSVSGPATMVAYTSYAVKQGFAKVIQIAALLSISIGIFNLLPFAPLDGGQMMVAVVEMLRRGKRLSIQVQSTVSAIGLTFIVVLVLSAWFFDFQRWFGPQPEAGKTATIKKTTTK